MYDLIKCMAIKLATPGNFYDDSRKGCGMDKFRKLRKDYDDDHPPNLDDQYRAEMKDADTQTELFMKELDKSKASKIQ